MLRRYYRNVELCVETRPGVLVATRMQHLEPASTPLPSSYSRWPSHIQLRFCTILLGEHAARIYPNRLKPSALDTLNKVLAPCLLNKSTTRFLNQASNLMVQHTCRCTFRVHNKVETPVLKLRLTRFLFFIDIDLSVALEDAEHTSIAWEVWVFIFLVLGRRGSPSFPFVPLLIWPAKRWTRVEWPDKCFPVHCSLAGRHETSLKNRSTFQIDISPNKIRQQPARRAKHIERRRGLF